MIPGVAVLQRLKLISECVSLSDWTLSNTIHAIHMIREKLPNTMPVNCRAILLICVRYVNNNVITPAGFDQRTRKRAVEYLAASLLETIGEELFGR